MQQKRSPESAGWLRFSMAVCLLAMVMKAESSAEVMTAALKPEVSSYIVVVDGGSTASRAHVFFYKPRVLVEPESEDFIVKRPITLPVELFFVEHSPGVSSFKGNHSGLATYMKDMTKQVVKRLLDHDKHIPLSDVPIYFGATAGLRGMPEQEQADMLGTIRQVFEQGPLYYGHPIQARVLAGEEEGVYGWLMENYYHGQICSDAEKTVGVLDMGGESAEVSFMPQSYSPLAGAFAMHFGPFPGSLHVYSHSYMNFGIVAGFQKASAQLMTGLRRDEKASASHLVHPCLPKGISWHVREGEFGVSTVGFASRSDGPLTLEGQGHFEDCLTAAENVIVAADAACTLPPCTLMGVYQPSFEGTTFWLIGEYSNIWQLMGAFADHGPRLEALKSRAKSFCALSHAEQARELAKQPGVSTAEPALACWLAAWSYAFLTKGLHLPSNYSGLEIDPLGARGWPEGAAIYHVNNFVYRVLLGKTAKKFEKSEKHAMHKLRRGLKKVMKTFVKHAKKEEKHGHTPVTAIPSTLLWSARGGFMPEVSPTLMVAGAWLLVIILSLSLFSLLRRAAAPEAPGLQPLLVASA
eukprot:TRINITY_DN10707_c0_g1_i4.p1 TRINITY_DN10707_c0_g1~~TRINITY_DN10707_c0_g1_i4.p1  ORF type:complete len:580 (-),score=120.64 TRINITY_DN10707_c0_g1_i4:142-1881(-)